MSKENFEITTEFGALIDGSADNFRNHCADKNLGYVSGLRNYIAGAFQSFVKMKEDLLDVIKKEGLPETSEHYKTLKGIYNELMKLEEKACICVEILNERKLKD